MTPAEVRDAIRRNREQMSGPRSVREACAAAGLDYGRVRKQMSRETLTADVADALRRVLEAP